MEQNRRVILKIETSIDSVCRRDLSIWDIINVSERVKFKCCSKYLEIWIYDGEGWGLE